MAMPNGRMSRWGLQRRRRLASQMESAIVPVRQVRRRLNPVSSVPRLFPKYFADTPPRKYCKLRYVVTESITGPAVGAIVVRQYRANGMYDPEVAVGGHQPFGFDQLMGQYHHFTVIKSKCTLELMQTSDNTPITATLAIVNTSGVMAAAFAAGGQDAIAELPFVSRNILHGGTFATQRQRSTFMWCDVPKMAGKTVSELIGNTAYSGDNGSDPTEDFLFSVGYTSANNTDQSTKSVPYRVTIDYYAIFSEPRWFTTS